MVNFIRTAIAVTLLATHALAHFKIIDVKDAAGENKFSSVWRGRNENTDESAPVLEANMTSFQFVCGPGKTGPDQPPDTLASPGSGSVTVAAGGSIKIQWELLRVFHPGVLLTYMAKLDGGDFKSAKAENLKFFKANHYRGDAAGEWATSVYAYKLNGIVSTKIPANLPAGKYIMRQEWIAIHDLGKTPPEYYPWCLNVEVTGGSSTPATLDAYPASKLYEIGNVAFRGGLDIGLALFDLKGPDRNQWKMPGPRPLDASYADPVSGVVAEAPAVQQTSQLSTLVQSTTVVQAPPTIGYKN
ncbi:glycosyl hydrolase family 61-domain-containing protein [Dendryphion nanum]|uniref:lytic cellulose monooxygenase (C4-dehydrogenating) n=1 Tax=Dendryphion nanum TaxID=256645 RepID=A0A9P9IFF5_9PLEO|nr:glycosyl hydrolase family 61-domain-containing protein [Dendryphion nanum]